MRDDGEGREGGVSAACRRRREDEATKLETDVVVRPWFAASRTLRQNSTSTIFPLTFIQQTPTPTSSHVSD